MDACTYEPGRTPHGVRGLKQDREHHVPHGRRRTPHGVRGLKHGEVPGAAPEPASHPARGAWIETA